MINMGLATSFVMNSHGEFSSENKTSSKAYAEEATTHLPLPSGSYYSSGGIPVPNPEDGGQDLAKKAIMKAVEYGKIMASVVAVLFIILMGVRYVTSGGDEEAIKKSTKGLLMSILALAMISMSKEVAEIVGFYGASQGYSAGTPQGGILDPDNMVTRVTLFDKRVEVIMVFIKYFIGALAVLIFITNAARLVVAGGEEENVKKARNGIMYSILGLLILLVGNTFVENIFYTVDKNVYPTTGVTPTTSIERGIEEIVGITNFVVSFVGPLLLILILIGGIMYLTAGGEEERMNKAKRLLIAAFIGVIVIYGAFAIVSTVTTGYFSEPANIQDFSTLETKTK